MDVSKQKIHKTAIVSSILPETNYSRYLTGALQKTKNLGVEVFVYTDKNPQNLDVPLKNVKLVWSKNFLYPFQIFLQARHDHLDLIHIQHEINMYGGLLTALIFPILPILLRILRIKTVITIHAVVKPSEIDERLMRTFSFPTNRIFIPILKLFFFCLYSFCLRFSDLGIVHANTLRDILIKEYRAWPSKVIVNPVGVPEYDLKSPTKKINSSWLVDIRNKKIILYFGYLVKRKGLEDLLEAFKIISPKYPEYILVLAGGTLQKEYENELKNRAKNLKSVLFTSFVSADELKYLLKACEFVVLPATYSIAGSGPLAEAISFRKPVIVPKLGVLAEEVEDRSIGLQYKALDTASLKEAIMELISNEPLRERLSKNMQKRYDERIWPKIADKTISFYKQLIN